MSCDCNIFTCLKFIYIYDFLKLLLWHLVWNKYNFLFRCNLGSIQPRKKVVCELCGKDFTATSLYAHIKICQTTKLKCTTCKRSFVGEKELKSHVCKHFSCNLCDQQFMMVRNLELHKLEHNGEEFFHCDFCEGLYRTRKQYLAHRRESHTNPRDKNHKCEKCDKEFINARQLRKHYRVHSNGKIFMLILFTRFIFSPTKKYLSYFPPLVFPLRRDIKWKNIFSTYSSFY